MLSIFPSELVSRRSRLFESVSVYAHTLIKVVAMLLFIYLSIYIDIYVFNYLSLTASVYATVCVCVIRRVWQLIKSPLCAHLSDFCDLLPEHTQCVSSNHWTTHTRTHTHTHTHTHTKKLEIS